MIHPNIQQAILRNITADLDSILCGLGLSLTCVDVGAKGGMSLIPKSLKKHYDLVGFEPNADEYDKISGNNSGFRKEKIYNTALWSCAGELDFCETITPGASTFMGESIQKYAENIYLDYKDGDPRVGKNFFETHTRTIKKYRCKTARLDSVLDQEDYIDLLKVDVEGAELEVFKGSQHLFDKKRVLFIYSEFMAVPYYESHPLLCDHFSFLRDNGFRLIHMDLDHASYSLGGHRFLPAHLSNPMLHSGDAFYMLDPATHDYTDQEMVRCAVQCFLFGFNNLGMDLIKKSGLVNSAAIESICKNAQKLRLSDWIRLNWNSLPETQVKRFLRKIVVPNGR